MDKNEVSNIGNSSGFHTVRFRSLGLWSLGLGGVLAIRKIVSVVYNGDPFWKLRHSGV